MKALNLLVIFCTCLFAAYADDETPQGRFGQPLGTYLTIEGFRADSGKVGVRTLLVDTVNGKKLDKPVLIWIENVESLPKDERCVLKGYESGKMTGTPPAVVEAAKEAGKEISPTQVSWQFFRFFVMTSVVQPVGLTEKPELTSYLERLRARREAMQKKNVEPPSGDDSTNRVDAVHVTPQR